MDSGSRHARFTKARNVNINDSRLLLPLGQVTKGNRNMATRGKRGKRPKPAALSMGKSGKAAVHHLAATNAAPPTTMGKSKAAVAGKSKVATAANAARAAATGKSKVTVKHLQCWRCGGLYVAPSRQPGIKETGKKRKGKRGMTFVERRLASGIFLCSSCLQLEMAEEQAIPDYSDTPRDQREVTSRLNIRTRYHG
jgi:hypothetical protein